MLSSRISDYPTITQGKTRIPGVNDAEELEILDVSLAHPDPEFANTFRNSYTPFQPPCTESKTFFTDILMYLPPEDSRVPL